MKNLYLIPTDKPSRLWTNNLRRRIELDEFPEQHPNQIAKHIYITSDEEIKDGWSYDRMMKSIGKRNNVYSSKIILTTDSDLIKDGVQAIDDEFLEWFIKNPSCEEVEVVDDLKYFNVDELRERHIKVLPHLYSERIGYKIIIPSEEPKQETNLKKHLDSCEEYQGPRRSAIVDKQETLEETALRLYPEEWDWKERKIFIKGAKWMQERMYSEEDIISFAEFVATYPDKNRNANGEMLHAKSKYDGAERTIDLLKQYKK